MIAAVERAWIPGDSSVEGVLDAGLACVGGEVSGRHEQPLWQDRTYRRVWFYGLCRSAWIELGWD